VIERLAIPNICCNSACFVLDDCDDEVCVEGAHAERGCESEEVSSFDGVDG